MAYPLSTMARVSLLFFIPERISLIILSGISPLGYHSHKKLFAKLGFQTPQFLGPFNPYPNFNPGPPKKKTRKTPKIKNHTPEGP